MVKGKAITPFPSSLIFPVTIGANTIKRFKVHGTAATLGLDSKRKNYIEQKDSLKKKLGEFQIRNRLVSKTA